MRGAAGIALGPGERAAAGVGIGFVRCGNGRRKPPVSCVGGNDAPGDGASHGPHGGGALKSGRFGNPRGVNAMRLGLPAALLLALAAAPAVAGGGSQTKTDPCALATLEEVADALEEDVGPGMNDGIGDCQYQGASGYSAQLQIGVDENEGRAGFFDSQAAAGMMKPIDDVGDGALYFDSPAGFTQLLVLKGDILMSITLSSGRVKDPLAAATELARAAVERLGTEASLAKIPGLEALVGRWYGNAGAPSSATTDRRSWEIDEDGRWRMTSAPELSGYLAAQDGVFRVESPRESWGGRYEIEDQDHISTSGDLAAEFTRIPDGAMPEGVDPALLGIWSGIGLTGNAPIGPIEATLVGYWQAKAEQDGAPVTYIWRINDQGYAVLTVVSTLEGELTAEGGVLEVSPDEGDGFTASYKVLSPDAFETSDETGSIRWGRRGTGIIPD